MTSDDPSKALYLVSLLSSSARSYLDAYKQRVLRPDSEVADMEYRLGLASRYVDPVFPAQPATQRGFGWRSGYAVEHVC